VEGQEEMTIVFAGRCPYCPWENLYRSRAKAERGLAIHIVKSHRVYYDRAIDMAKSKVTEREEPTKYVERVVE